MRTWIHKNSSIILVIIGVITILIMLAPFGTGRVVRRLVRVVSPQGVKAPYILTSGDLKICTTADGDFIVPDDCGPDCEFTVKGLHGETLGSLRLPNLRPGTNPIIYTPNIGADDSGSLGG